MKLTFQLTITPRTVAHPPLFPKDGNGNPQPDIVQTTILECSWHPKEPAGKEGNELRSFSDFARTNEFWRCVEALKPGTTRTETITIEKHSEGDDPPDLAVLVPSGAIGVELTDCSPIAACVAKVSSQMEGSAAIPGPSDAKTYKDVQAFMLRPVSLVKPHFSDLPDEKEALVSYLVHQIKAKDVPGNDILLLTGSFMGGWPECEFASIANSLVKPKNIKIVVLVSENSSTII